MLIEKYQTQTAKIYYTIQGEKVKRRLIICKAKDLLNNI